ncbi:MAG: hypothetical protein JST17_06725 [Bacteroidetes bacterium]|nr:hypothetical protein [Bacteroidota bacterium]MBS1929748.1 hypothetical protein [Bacteroidota bacterium]
MDNTTLIQSLNKELELELPEKISFEEIKKELSSIINNLIQSDFQRLVFLLYRIDVNETKLKKLLKEHPEENAGNIITELIIERQQQKIKSRQQFNQQDENISDDEKW